MKHPPRKKPPHKAQRPWPPWAYALVVAVLCFLVYLPSLHSGFVYDAEAQILTDNYIHDSSHLWEVLTLRVMSRDVLDFNRPIHLLSLMMDSLLWGKQPAGYHLTSNFLHALNAGMLCLLLLLLLTPRNVSAKVSSSAALASLLFAIHPVNVEAVAEVSYREDLLATGFLLVSLLATITFARHRDGKAVVWGGVVIGSILLACSSKETGAIGPILLGLVWLLFYRHQPWQRWALLVGSAVAVVAGFFLVRSIIAPQSSVIFTAPPLYLGGSFSQTLLIQPRIWAFLFLSIIWPTSLSADYVAQNVLWISLPAALIALSIFVVLQIWLAWKSRVAAFGMAIFWLGLAPVSNFVPLYRPLADRFLYLPMVGVALIVATVLLHLTTSSRWKIPSVTFVVLGLIVWSSLNIQRQMAFSSPLALWANTLDHSPFSHTAANNLGYAQLHAKAYESALVNFQKAWELTQGKKADAAAGAAIAYEQLGHPAQAEAALRQAIALDARYAQPEMLTQALIMPREFSDILAKIVARLPKNN